MTAPREYVTLTGRKVLGYLVKGRPDLHEYGFRERAMTISTRCQPYVHSKQGALMHRLLHLRLEWYECEKGGHNMIRLVTPRAFAVTSCGMTFFLFPTRRRHEGRSPARVCKAPDGDAVLCGKCQGDAPTFAPQGAGTAQGLTRQAARVRLRCVTGAFDAD